MNFITMPTFVFIVTIFTLYDVSWGLSCYNCKNLDTVSRCFFKSSCAVDELCKWSRYPDESGRDLFTLGCMSKELCSLVEEVNLASSVLGKRTFNSLTKCCSTDNCNKNLVHGLSSASTATSASTQAKTTVALTTTHAPTTTQLPTTHVPTTTQLLTTHAPTTTHSTAPTTPACVDKFKYCNVNQQIKDLSCTDPDLREQCQHTCGDCP